MFNNISYVQASELKLSIDPQPINLTVKPGNSISTKLKISNAGTQNETIRVGLLKFNAFGEEGIPRIKDREIGDDYFDWVTFSDNDFILVPNEWKIIDVNINVPQTAAFGYYYAVTFSRKQEAEVENKSASKISGSIANLIMLNVESDKAISNIDLLSFNTDKRIYDFLPANFISRLSNTGNVHMSPRGNIFISSKKQKDIAILEVNETKNIVLPGSNRSFETSWYDGTPVYSYKDNDESGIPKKYLNWDSIKLNKIRFGKYTATMVLIYFDGKKDIPIQATTSFWVIPWKLILIAIVAVGLMIMGFYSSVSNIKNKIKK